MSGLRRLPMSEDFVEIPEQKISITSYWWLEHPTRKKPRRWRRLARRDKTLRVLVSYGWYWFARVAPANWFVKTYRTETAGR